MRFIVSFILILLISACSGTSRDTNTPTSPTEKDTPSKVYHYQCESGATITAIYPTTDSATIQYKSHDYKLEITRSGSGSRYIDKNLEWWTKGLGAGAEGTLFRHKADGTTGDSLEFCTQK